MGLFDWIAAVIGTGKVVKNGNSMLDGSQSLTSTQHRELDNLYALAKTRHLTEAEMTYLLDSSPYGSEYNTAFECVMEQGNDGNAGASMILGAYFLHQNEYDLSLFNFRRAAKSGHARAQDALALMLVNGTGGPPNLEEANYWLLKAAEQEYFIAQFKLGLNCVNGKGMQPDIAMAYIWIARAIKNADPYSDMGKKVRSSGPHLLEQLASNMSKEDLARAKQG